MGKEDILIIDDNRLTRDTLALLLNKEGFSVNNCADGMCAVDLSQKQGYQIYVVDYNMPGLKGDEVASRLRKLCPESFIIGYSVETREKAFLSAGADKFIVKDDLIKNLMPIIKDVMSVRSLKTSNQIK